MSTTNGELQPPHCDSPSMTLSTPGKRKRGSSSEEVSAGDRDGASNPSEGSKKTQIDQMMRDLFLVLSRYDSDRLLKLPLPLRSSLEPETKRAKLSGDAHETSTIESRITSGNYNSVQELVDDVESASSLAINQQQRRDAGANGVSNSDRLSAATDIVIRTAAFKKHLDNFLRRALLKDTSQVKSEPKDGKDEPSVSDDNNKKTLPREEGGIALTIYGNSLNPKQLFSSLKRPTRVNLQSQDSGPVSGVEVQTPLGDVGLPTGLTATEVASYKADVKDKKPTKTFGETFYPQATLPQLEPVRKGKPLPKNSTLNWVDWFDVATDSRSLPGERGGYNYSALPAGHWLNYGGRVASISNTKNQPDSSKNGDADSRRPSDSDEQRLLAEEKALFQSTYSSFAPSFDSSGAIIPEETKDQMWWNKLGADRFRALTSLQYPEDELPESAQEDNIPVSQELDESTLEEAVNAYVHETEFPEFPKTKDSSGSAEDKDMEEILNEIGELLETLNSYNRIRNLAPPNASHSTPAAGTPDTPSAAEISVYETLKASLSAMIATLPPYAVSKLNGDQLSDLNISKKVLIETTDYAGTMEVDEYTAAQRHASRIAASSSTSRTPAPNMGAASRSNSYQASPTVAPFNQRAISSNPRAHQSPRGYQPQQLYGARQPQPNHYSPNIAPQSYPASRQPAATPQRPAQVPQKYPQSASSQYGQGSTLQQFQRSSQNGVGRYSPQQGHLQAQNSPKSYQQRPQPNYPQRGQDGVYNTPLAAGRGGSPQKPPGYGTPQQHSPYMNSTPNSQQRYIHPQQQKPHHQLPQQQPQLPHYNNFPSSRTPSMSNPVPNSATIAATMTYQRSAAEQAALMDRNKTQLDVHQQRRGSMTPQSPHVMQQHLPSNAQPRAELPQETNHTPGSQQNGVTNFAPGGNP